MHKLIISTLCMTILLTQPSLRSEEDIQILPEQTEELYRPGAGSQDGAFTSLSLSMLGWGVGLAAGIGILASVLYQSTSAHESDSSGCNAHNH